LSETWADKRSPGSRPKKNDVHQSDQRAHRRDHQPSQSTGQQREHDDTRFTRSHYGTQAMRNFELFDPGHEERNSSQAGAWGQATML